MRIVAGMQQLEVKLESASSHDFRSILIPLVKSFLQARLEDLAEKDATRKSDAAREAFLAELARDPQKGDAGVDSLKHVHERTKEKKMSKENRKNKDQKAIHSYDLQHLTAGEILLPSAHEEEGPISGIALPLPDDVVQLEKEVYQRRIELETEEKKLEETLEYQRRIENEAKHKHLADQHKKLSSTTSEKTETIEMQDAYWRQYDHDKYANEQLTNRKVSLPSEVKCNSSVSSHLCGVDDGFPVINFVFKDSLSLPVYPHSYLFEVRVRHRILHRLAEQHNADKQLTILGDIALSDKLVLYDLENETIGWAQYNCSSNIIVKVEASGHEYDPGVFLDDVDSHIKCRNFIHKEVILFSMADVQRSIPSMVDRLKPGQRKILYYFFKA
ncbi:hypothetical protein ACS0TY_002379 [Phlomoides rotata]